MSKSHLTWARVLPSDPALKQTIPGWCAPYVVNIANEPLHEYQAILASDTRRRRCCRESHSPMFWVLLFLAELHTLNRPRVVAALYRSFSEARQAEELAALRALYPT